MFLLARSLGGETAGCVSALLFICEVFIIGWDKHLKQGIPRSFAYPLFISFSYYFVNKKSVKAFIGLVLQSLFYPPIFLNSVFLWGMSFIRKSWTKEEIKSFIIFVLGFICAGLILLYSYKSSPDFLGSIITRSEAKAMAELGANGRSDFFREHFYEYLFMGRAGLNLDKISGYILLLIPMGFVLGRGIFGVNRIIYDIIISSSVLFIIAHLVLFKLHLPSRYVLYTFPVAFNLIVALNFQMFVEGVRLKYNIDLIQKTPSAKKVFVVLTIITIVILSHKIHDFRPIVDKVGLYKFLSTLPKDVLIAGYPKDMDDIPLFSKRKVLMNRELALPYYKNYYSEIRRRTFDFFAAYYSNDPGEILGFCRKYGIDYIVVNKNHFNKEFLSGKIYYSPFGEYAKSLIEKNKTFVLDNIADSKKVFKNDTYYVVNCEKENLNYE
jgi:hypothetical protein